MLDGGQTFERIIAFRAEQERINSVLELPYKPMSTTATEIIKEICAYRGVLVKDVMSQSRLTFITEARQEICYWIRHKTCLSFTQIARKIKKHHTTVIHSYRKYGAKHGLPVEWWGVNSRARN